MRSDLLLTLALMAVAVAAAGFSGWFWSQGKPMVAIIWLCAFFTSTWAGGLAFRLYLMEREDRRRGR